jgi:molybdate transport system regulatory protein
MLDLGQAPRHADSALQCDKADGRGWRGLHPGQGGALSRHAVCGMMAEFDDRRPTPQKGRAEMQRGSRRLRPAEPTMRRGNGRRAVLTIRVDLQGSGYLGPGKIALLELIARHGSIAAAGKAMAMSYRRAWLLVDEINRIFRVPLVAKQMGGAGGGGAHLTAAGHLVIQRYRAIEDAAALATTGERRALAALLATRAARRNRGA